MTKTIFVTGATGKQGRYSIEALVDSGADVEILALTRNASSSRAKDLASLSPKIKLVEGDLDHTEAAIKAAENAASGPIWGLVSIQAAVVENPNEEAQGKALHIAAINHGIKFIVYASVDRHGSESDTTPTYVEHFASKFRVEKELFNLAAKSGTQWTILRPTSFMDNAAPDKLGSFFATTFKAGLDPTDTPMQLIACSDVGWFAAQALLNPEKYHGQKISLAGDNLTFKQCNEIYREVTGQDWPVVEAALQGEFQWPHEEVKNMFHWFLHKGWGADIDAVRKIHPGLKTFRDFLIKDLRLRQN